MEKQEVELRDFKSPLQSEQEDPNPVQQTAPNQSTSPIFSSSGISSWTKNFKILQSTPQETTPQSQTESTQSAFTRISTGFGLRFPAIQKDSTEQQQNGIIGSLTKGIVDSSMSAVKAVQVKARHMVSQNKRRFQADGFDLDMTYITDNIIAMGFPAGDLSSGLFGYFEGFYRNHMEEVIRFFETHHKGKYKVYNLCSERLYDASLLEGKVASFPFEDHNCPQMELIKSFCESASVWLKSDPANVVVVHCKAGMGRTGLMISSLLLYLNTCETAEECISYFNEKRCVDAKGLVLPSQIRYVEYFEHILKNLNCQVPAGRRCMLRGFRLHNCPNWIRPSITVSDHNGVLFSTKKHPRTKDMSAGDLWFKTPKKGIMVFGLPGEPGLAEVSGDFKVLFQDRQGDFYCWLNTTLTDNRKMLNPDDLDGFDKRKLPSPGFQLEVVLLDFDPSQPLKPTLANINFKNSKSNPNSNSTKNIAPKENVNEPQSSNNNDNNNKDKDVVFSDSDSDHNGSSKRVKDDSKENEISEGIKEVSLKSQTETDLNLNLKEKNLSDVKNESSESEFKAIAADASVFSFGDDDDYESECIRDISRFCRDTREIAPKLLIY